MMERYVDAGEVARWQRWIDDTVRWSKRTGEPAIVVSKDDHQLTLYENGPRGAHLPRRHRPQQPRTARCAPGDHATPEGRYKVTSKRNVGQTAFYKALMLDYPNQEDRKRFDELRRQGQIPRGAGPGNLIEIHGEGGRAKDWTRGCVAVSNEHMDSSSSGCEWALRSRSSAAAAKVACSRAWFGATRTRTTQAMTQPSIDSLARAAFVEAAPRRRRLRRRDRAVGAGDERRRGAGGGRRALERRRRLGRRLPIPAAARGAGARSVDRDRAPRHRSQGSERKLEAESKKLLASLERRTPRGSYVVVDRTNNLLYLRKPDEVALQAVCSAGSGSILKEPNGKRTWVFDTPQGQFKVISILKNPIWRKPDWAFIEEGEPIPTDVNERFEPGMLGEFGLYFGDGFLIHGTLYERLLGRNVTHGCIRLGKKDLRELVQATRLGTQIYIF